MYVDEMTDSVRNAMEITNKRRKIQLKYNELHNITPKTTTRTIKEKKEKEESYDKTAMDISKMPKDELNLLIKDLESDMKEAAKNLNFEKAAEIRNKLFTIKEMKN